MTNEKQAEYNLQLIEIIESKKTEQAKNLKDIMPLLRTKDPSDMTDVNALSLSYRVILIEEQNYFLNELAQEHKKLKDLRKDKFIFYSTGYLPDGTRPKGNLANHPLAGNSKLTKSDKELLMVGDFSSFEHTQEILENIIDCLKEYIKTIDQILYGIKNRLELLNYLGNKR